MKVFKFGGASVKDSESVKNVAYILKMFSSDQLIAVVSAMGKTTNLLEAVLSLKHQKKVQEKIEEFKKFHLKISSELGIQHSVSKFLDQRILEIKKSISANEDAFETYDRVVSQGELTSTFIISEYIKTQDLSNVWLDVRNIIKTTDSHKNANVLWKKSAENISYIESAMNQTNIIITQGFIGSTETHKTTTLGREGSDFSAAILAYLADSENVTIWKDVDGMLNADPRHFSDTVKLDEVSYREAIELAYFGASVIHPKTIKPLQNKNINLYVKSFYAPAEKGTVIKDRKYTDPLVPSYILKSNQTLISISPKDFSFVAENHLSIIFETLSKLKASINLMQNSALNFSIVVDHDKIDLKKLNIMLNRDFYLRFNEGLELITIRHFTDQIIEKLTRQKSTYLEQRSRKTIRLVVK